MLLRSMNRLLQEREEEEEDEPSHVRIQEPRGLKWTERGDATVICAKIQKG